MTQIRAARLHCYGGPETVMLDDVPAPFPADGQAAVRVTTAGINPVDAKLCSGALQQVMPMQLPVTLGAEVSGRVEALGAGVTGMTVGQRVIAWTGNLGAYAQFNQSYVHRGYGEPGIACNALT